MRTSATGALLLLALPWASLAFAQALEENERRFRRVAHDLDVRPRDAPRPAGTQRLEDRLFRGESGGVVLGPALRARIAVRAFVRCEAVLQKALAVTVDHALYAPDLGQVDALLLFTRVHDVCHKIIVCPGSSEPLIACACSAFG